MISVLGEITAKIYFNGFRHHLQQCLVAHGAFNSAHHLLPPRRTTQGHTRTPYFPGVVDGRSYISIEGIISLLIKL